MNTETRVLTALRREEPDCVPVFIYLNPYVDAWYTDDPSYAEVLEACKQYADIIYNWSFPRGFFCSAVELPSESRAGCDGIIEHILHTPRGPLTSLTAPSWRGRDVRKRWICSEEDARRVLSIPYVASRPDLTSFFSTKSRLRTRAVAQVTLPDPICVIGGITEEESLAMWTIERRGLIRELLDVALERLLEILHFCLEHDVGPIYYFNGPEYALPPLMSPKDFEEFVVEYDTPLVQLIHSYPGKAVIVHSHGRVNRFLERFAAIGMDGLNVLEPPPMGDTVLSDAKRRVGDRLCLIGNIQYDDLVRGSKQELDYLVREAIRQGAPGGGFILSPCASPYERPLPQKASEHLVYYLTKGRAYGRYPRRLRMDRTMDS